MAYTKAQTSAISQGSAVIGDAKSKFTALQNQLNNMSLSYINQPGTWFSPGAAVMANAMQQINADLSKILNSLGNIGDNVGVSGNRLNNAMATEHSTVVSQFANLLGTVV